MQVNDFSVTFFDELDSTNNFAKDFLDKNEKKKHCNKVIVAENQTEGRGAFENKWTSEKELNLTFSIIICPNISAKDQFYISKITSLVLIKYFKNNAIEAKIKWPNDILIKNKKIAGILIENSIIGNSLSNSIVGIGININQIHFPPELNAISLKTILKKVFSKTIELKNILAIYSYYLNLCKNQKFGIINELYFQNLLGNNEYLTYKKDDCIFEAIIEDIDEF
ncbi:MAG: biotin--[acetyl-CoA-carboxylase] ligase, partial [Bacteroidota bacterium]|nr:biotin--[acetyl-CoA-carboxylase] ligase [Bacteroidota bacterium]